MEISMIKGLKKIFYILSLILLFIINHDIKAQNFCTQNLRKAQLTYDEGRISEVPGILESCLKDGFNKEEKAAAYRLLTLTYLYMDEPVKADEAMLKLLSTNHEYVLNSSVDPAEFINLYNKFRTHPVFRIGIKGGINWMDVRVIEVHSLSGDPIEDFRIKSGIGTQVGVSVEIPLKNSFELSPEFMLTSKQYSYNYKVAEQRSVYQEKMTWADIPIVLKYNFGEKKYMPFVTAGLNFNYLLASFGSVSGDVVSPSTSVLIKRIMLSYALIMGAGVKDKVGPGILSLGFRYVYGLNNQVKDKERYHNNGTFPFSYGAVDSQFRLSTFSINLGYVIPIYNPQKIR